MKDDDTAAERNPPQQPAEPLSSRLNLHLSLHLSLHPSLQLHEPQPLGAPIDTPVAGTFRGASAEQALATVFPTVARLVGDEAFGALARACWRAHPACVGDLARFALQLPNFIAADAQFPDVPCLPDSARLDWAMAEAERAADARPQPQSFSLLAEHEPDALALVCAPGMAVLRSGHPIVDIRQAQEDVDHADRRLAAAGVAIAQRRGQIALVWRQGWKARVQAIDFSDARWCEALAAGLNLGAALQTSSEQGEEFAFEPWLLQALHQRWVIGVRKV